MNHVTDKAKQQSHYYTFDRQNYQNITKVYHQKSLHISEVLGIPKYTTDLEQQGVLLRSS